MTVLLCVVSGVVVIGGVIAWFRHRVITAHIEDGI